MELEAVTYEVADRIATVTLSRPHRRNAWTGRMHHDYRTAMTAAEADPDVRVVVVTGAGDSFCVGADSKALAGHADKGGYDDGLRGAEPPMPDVAEEYRADFAFQFGMSTPVLAAVNGAAAGVGLVVAAFADLRFGLRSAKLTTAAPKLGLPAEYGLSWLLPRQIGMGRAADWLLSGRVVLGDEAERVGFFNAAFDSLDGPDGLGAHVRSYATTLANHVAPSSLRTTKAQLYTDLRHDDVARSVRDSRRLLDEMIPSPDYLEGSRALVEKRLPHF